ncbi:MAG TPA: rhamnulokinase family protein [Chthoniobacteraceae bacterium]|nr:rhamnulokinase family protein [Chthoniobacteraceae bacterium]
MKHHYVACDLGAESGRVMLGTLENGRLHLEEIHRFPTGGTRWFGSLRWNLPRIYEELLAGLGKIRDVSPAGVSVDSWGVDYALFRRDVPLLSLPFHYRDGRTEALYGEALERLGREAIFRETGIQSMNINTLFQLLAEAAKSPELLALAERFLNIGDYFNYLLSGVARAEESLASTTQLYDPRTRQWACGLIAKAGLAESIFPEIVPSATVLGPLLPGIGAALPAGDQWSQTKVIATCSHDTGCAVAAVPATGEQWAYLSSGTWSLVGVELPEPLMNEAVERANFTNEAGVAGTTRFLKNTAGLWILQECRRAWKQQGESLDYAALAQQAGEAEPLRSLINPGDPCFLRPDGMPERIAQYCRERGEPVPETPGAFARCIFESLALLYRETLGQITTLTGRRLRTLHIVGGGSRNALLNQFSANATGLTVLAGPAEATATGNLLIQALALGHLPSLAALRQVVADSVTPARFEPQEAPLWDAAYERFLNLH